MSERQQTRLPLAAPWPGGHLAVDPARVSEDTLRLDTPAASSLIEQTLRAVFPIKDFNETSELTFVSYDLRPPRRSPAECRRAGATYAEELRLTLYLLVYDVTPDGARTVRNVKEQEVLLCELPRLTPEGTFVIVGVDRVVVRQLAESPGVRFLPGPAGQLRAVIAPKRGPKLTFEHDRKGLLWARIGATKKKLPATTILRALGLVEREILASLHDIETVDVEPGGAFWLRIDPARLVGQRMARDIRVNGEVIVRRHGKVTRSALRRLQEAGVTRLPLAADELLGRVLADDVVDENSGEVMGEVNHALTAGMLRWFTGRGTTSFTLVVCDGLRASTTIVDTLRADPNHTTDEALMAIYRALRPGDAPTLETARYLFENLFFNPQRYDLSPAGRASLDRKLSPPLAGPDEVTCLTRQDVIGTVRELQRRQLPGGWSDDVDHTDEAVVNDAAAMTADALRRGLERMERAVKERLSMAQDPEELMPADLINGKPVQRALDDFFGWSRVAERVDLTSPLAELTQRRRLTTSDPDADSARRSVYRRRDRHDSHLGVFCPVETPRLGGHAPSLGLTVGPRGELRSGVAPGEWPTGSTARYDELRASPPGPWQVLGLGAALVPFVHHDEPEAAAAGVENLRSALPPMRPEAARVATGLEAEVAHSSGLSVLAVEAGRVEHASGREIVVRGDSGERRAYPLRTFEPAPRGAHVHHRPVVRAGDRVEPGELLAAGPGVAAGELALGHDLLTALLPTFDTSLVVSESVVREGKFASLQLRSYRTHLATWGLDGGESLDRDAPGLDDDERATLGPDGLVRVGTHVRGGDVLVGQVATREELVALGSDGPPEPLDRSLRLPAGREGVVVEARIESSRQARLPRGARQRATVVVATRQPLGVGDLLGSRHGERGTVARIAPVEDMPVLPDGRPVEVVLNPSLLIERGAGLLMEMLAGSLGLPVLAPPFGPVSEAQLRAMLGHGGRVELRDGRTGEPFDAPVTVGHLHLVRLPPLAADAMEARSSGPYEPHTDLPAARGHEPGGQLIDENDVAALAAHGAAHTLRELLGVKGDDARARDGLLDALRSADEPPALVPAGLDALVRELRAAALDLTALDPDDLPPPAADPAPAATRSTPAPARDALPSPGDPLDAPPPGRPAGDGARRQRRRPVRSR